MKIIHLFHYFPLQNAAIEKLTGYSLVELQDKKVWDFQGMASDQILNENDEVTSRTILVQGNCGICGIDVFCCSNETFDLQGSIWDQDGTNNGSSDPSVPLILINEEMSQSVFSGTKCTCLHTKFCI